MSPYVKYTLGRLGLFVIVFVLLLPLPLNILVKAMIAFLISAIASYFLLSGWAGQVGERMASAASRRSAEKERLRAALAGDEEAAAAGDRAAAAGDRAAAAGDRAAEPKPAEAQDPQPAEEKK
jgi:hypothetical protein